MNIGALWSSPFFTAIFIVVLTILIWKWKPLADAIGSLSSLWIRSSSSSDAFYRREEAYLRRGRGDGDGAVGPAVPTIVPNERVAPKLRGYFELAKQEIDKAVRAEEWALPDVAVDYYKNAHRILLEAKGTPVPSTISFIEQEKVDSFRQKINNWHDNVVERLEVLGHSGAGTTSTKKVKTGKLERKPASMRKYFIKT